MKYLKYLFFALLISPLIYFSYCFYTYQLTGTIKTILKFFFDNMIAIFVSVYIIDKITSYRDKKSWQPVMDIFSTKMLKTIDDIIFRLAPHGYTETTELDINFQFTSYVVRYDIIDKSFNNPDTKIILNNFYHQKEILVESFPQYISTLDNILAIPTKYEPSLISDIIKINNFLQELLNIAKYDKNILDNKESKLLLKSLILDCIIMAKETRIKIIEGHAES